MVILLPFLTCCSNVRREGRSSVEGVKWDICVSARLSLKHVVIEAAGAFTVEAYFSNGRLVIAVQRAFRHHLDIPPRGRVLPDRNRPAVAQWSWQACHEFEPSTTKDPPCRAAMYVKSIGS
ncbi:hypothetical protein TNCV_1568511 [Trichonephila clavipes]|nr:hypothetical protein TNCV_1568511 [Trichonephila clavipes]